MIQKIMNMKYIVTEIHDMTDGRAGEEIRKKI
jgi:hypothetical protein